MKRISSIVTFICLILLMQSCLKEDEYVCEGSLQLRFRYTLNNQHSNLFDSVVDKITVFVFDCKGEYVGTFSQMGDMLTNEYIMKLALPQGAYSVVALGGDLSSYSIKDINGGDLKVGITDIKDFRVELNSTSGESPYIYPANTPNDLYIGILSNIKTVDDIKTINDLELTKNTKKINVKITSSQIAPQLDIYIIAKNGRYLYNNSIDNTHGTLKYTPINIQTQSNYTEADLKIMRLTLDQSPMLVIVDRTTGEIIYRENMINQILLTQKYHSQEDIDREEQFVFEINIASNNNNIAVLISINGWKINIINPY